MMDQIKNSKSSPDKKDSPKDQNPTTVVPDNKKATPLEGGCFTKIGGMWTLKHDIISPNSMKSSLRHESKAILVFTSSTSTNTSIHVSMR